MKANLIKRYIKKLLNWLTSRRVSERGLMCSLSCSLDLTDIKPFYGEPQCHCTTGHTGVDYRRDKVAYVQTSRRFAPCPICGYSFFLFINGQGAEANACYLLKERK